MMLLLRDHLNNKNHNKTLTTVFECPGLFSSEDPVEYSCVDHTTIEAKVIVEGRSDVPHCVQLLPHPRILQGLCILGYMES